MRRATDNCDQPDCARLVAEMHKRLFIGNGTPSLYVRLDRVERVVQALTYVTGAVCVSLLVAGITAVAKHMGRA